MHIPGEHRGVNRSRRVWRIHAFFSLLAVVIACTAPRPGDADLVLLNAKVITADSADRIAQGIAIKDGASVVAGRDSAARAMAGSRTERIDVKGATVTQGSSIPTCPARAARGSGCSCSM